MIDVTKAIKEFKCWFFRMIHKTSGAEADQEVGFPLEREINGTQRRQRLASGDFPSEAMFKKLIASSVFAIEKNDKAKDSLDANYSQNSIALGGHVTVATDAEAKGKDNGVESLYTRVPRTSQLPSVEALNNIGDTNYAIFSLNGTFPLDSIEVTVDSAVPTRDNYLVGLSDTFVEWTETLVEEIKLYIDSIAITGGAVTYGGTNLITVNTTSANTNIAEQYEITADISPVSFVNGVVTQGGSNQTSVIEISPNVFQINIDI